MTNRTTIRNIDEDALWDAKIYAAETQQTMGDVFTEAIQCLVHQHDSVTMAAEKDDEASVKLPLTGEAQ